MDLLLDVDGDGGDGEVLAVLLVLAFPYELGVERGVARVEDVVGRALLGSDETA